MYETYRTSFGSLNLLSYFSSTQNRDLKQGKLLSDFLCPAVDVPIFSFRHSNVTFFFEHYSKELSDDVDNNNRSMFSLEFRRLIVCCSRVIQSQDEEDGEEGARAGQVQVSPPLNRRASAHARRSERLLLRQQSDRRRTSGSGSGSEDDSIRGRRQRAGGARRRGRRSEGDEADDDDDGEVSLFEERRGFARDHYANVLSTRLGL